MSTDLNVPHSGLSLQSWDLMLTTAVHTSPRHWLGGADAIAARCHGHLMLTLYNISRKYQFFHRKVAEEISETFAFVSLGLPLVPAEKTK